jgi:hypothetical protein
VCGNGPTWLVEVGIVHLGEGQPPFYVDPYPQFSRCTYLKLREKKQASKRYSLNNSKEVNQKSFFIGKIKIDQNNFKEINQNSLNGGKI